MVWRFVSVLFLSMFILHSAFAENKDKELVAVHDFNVTPSMEKLKINGWWISERMENELVQSGKYRVVTRARIARVLKEQNISAGPSLQPQELGKIVGAQYIVTGQADYSDGKINIVVNLIDASKKAGEIKRSFDASVPSAEGEVASRLPEILQNLAGKFSMGPGDFLDYGLEMMRNGDYEAAVQAFMEFERGIDIKKIDALIKTVTDKHLEKSAESLKIPGNTPGQMLDYGLELINKGDLKQAALVFYKLQNSQLASRINSLMQLAKSGAQKKNEVIGTILASARQKFENAIISRDKKEQQKDPAVLCDEAITELQAFLGNPKMTLSPDERRKVENLIAEIEIFRKKLFAGPSLGRGWSIPGVKMDFVPVNPGSFSARNALPSEDREEHEYTVKILKPFWIGKYEVSTGQFQYFLKAQNGSRKDRFEIDREMNFESPSCPLTNNYQLRKGYKAEYPMTCVSWRGAKKFCEWLNTVEKGAGRLPAGYEYRLPTEAEWEYSCRAGAKTVFHFGDNTADIDKYACYRSNSAGQAEACGSKQPSPWGTYDMHGNVWEWCNDWYSDKFLVADVENPRGPDASTENLKALRGGSFSSDASDLQCGARYSYDFKLSKKNIGFRVICAPEL